jgi:spore coat polysaccharide biosynthesis protein SpsF
LILAIIQARMGSTRLPGKVLLDIAGKPMLQWVFERSRLAKTVDEVVVATTTDPADDPVADFCWDRRYVFTRGSVHDVLDRFVRTARRLKADVVVRLTADCPLIDPGLVDETVRLLGSSLEFAANRLPPPWGRTFPIGLDVEVATMEALGRATEETSEKHHREHVMPYFYDDLPPGPLEGGKTYTTPRGFRIAQLHHTEDHGAVRWTVDTSEDLAAVRLLAERLPPAFNWLDALKIWQSDPALAALNAGVLHKTAHDIDPRA